MTDQKGSSSSPRPSLAGREVLAGGKVKGGMLRSHLAWVREFHPGDVDRLLKQLPPEMTKDLSGVILATTWYPFEWLIKLDRVIDEIFGSGRGELFAELGRYSARQNLSTTYRGFNRDDNHEFFVNSAPLHSQFQDFGTVRYEKTGDSSGRMIHSDYRCMSPAYCASAIGYYEQSILLHNAKNATVREASCQCTGAPCCTFEMQWS